MNNGNNSTDISSGSSCSSRGNGAQNKKNIIKKQLLPKEPKRGMGIAKLEKIRLSALNKSPYSQEFDMIGHAASHQSAYSLCQAPAPSSLSTFGNHQQPNADCTMQMKFGGLVEVNMTAAHSVNPQPFSWDDRSYAFDSNNAWAVRHQHQHQPHFSQPGVVSSRPTSLLIPSRARDAAGNIEMDLPGIRQKREEGVPNRDEEIDLELRL